MAEVTGIEWADATWPIVQGCDPYSPGCVNCYVIPLLWRHAHHPNPKISGPVQGLVERHKSALRFTGKVALREDRLDWPLTWRDPKRIFVPSHGDPFHKDVPDWFLDRIFAVAALCPQHQFLVLTKRSDRTRAYLSDPTVEARILLEVHRYLPPDWRQSIDMRWGHVSLDLTEDTWQLTWPLPNVWLGVSVEDQQRADERRGDLAGVAWNGWRTFVSYEPALGAVDWWGWGFLGWLISGGESGRKARGPSHPDWHRAARDFCLARGIPYFFKQWGNLKPICAMADGEADRLYRSNRIAKDGENQDTLDEVYGRTCRVPVKCLGYGGATGNDAFFVVDGHSGMTFFDVGKKAAGALLDGREWREMPSGLGGASCRN